LPYLPQTRGQARALAGAVLVAGSLGGVLAGAYLAGANVETSGTQARIKRLADAAAAGFSEAALKQSTAAMGPGALAAARRRDPALQAADAADKLAEERAAALLAARAIDRVNAPVPLSSNSGSQAAKLTLVSGPAAQPFRMAGALDSSRDLDCLTAAVYYETGSDTASGQAAVAQVVLNRVRHPSFPKSVCGVVYQGAAAGRCQFSFVCDGAMRRTKVPAMWENARRVASRALGGYVMAEAGEAVSFHAAYLGRLWSGSMQPVGRIGAHIFYRFGHGGGGFENPVYALETKPADGGPTAAPGGATTVLAQASPASIAPNGEGAGARLAVVNVVPAAVAAQSAVLAGQPASATVPAAAKPAAEAPKAAPAKTAPAAGTVAAAS
jgi:spore germination cell wall hydrolase CwlJ-like protein